MIKAFIIQTLLIVSTIICFGQDNKSEQIITKSCQRPIENKSIELCYIKADTLTFEQLKNCRELTISDIKYQVITSYLIHFILPNGDLREIRGTSNKIKSRKKKDEDHERYSERKQRPRKK